MTAEQFVAERFWPGATEDGALASMARVRASCEQLAASGIHIRWLGGTYLGDDECVSLRFEGTAQAVRAAHELADVPFDRLIPCVDDGHLPQPASPHLPVTRSSTP